MINYKIQESDSKRINTTINYNSDGSYMKEEEYRLPYYYHPLAEELAILVWKYRAEKEGTLGHFKANPNWAAVQYWLYIPTIREQLNEVMFEISRRIENKEKGYSKLIAAMKNIKRVIKEQK